MGADIFIYSNPKLQTEYSLDLKITDKSRINPPAKWGHMVRFRTNTESLFSYEIIEPTLLARLRFDILLFLICYDTHLTC